MDTIVESELELRLVLSSERSIPVPARLTYRSDDPFAMQVTFHVGSESPVRWSFARDLMVGGTFRPSGQGDVRIWPTCTDDRNLICMALSSPDGDALLQAPAEAVSAWLERTLRAVPPGSEMDLVGLESELCALLTTPPEELHLQDRSPADEAGEAGS
ncbi:SsgA family sporulation/cell division regulator [Streptomyces sp. ACA25]|uniref:SsgA family sporulation/cell division regulator n=1 Tax=Streptomyces sp. ACA25 TaxID=3022596 RepID=UPI002307C83A|nr:SsgA family sporulation/cell division regulator [Streptomyces sp. ACA25]MDB1089506.1 SsgA family sporulation/cell division regulator [Streptomyces sp. ACA25]